MKRRALMRSSPFLVPLLLTALLAPACSPAGRPSFDQAVDKLFAQGYPQALEAYFCSLGTSPALGFRWAGTSAERAVGDRVAAEMKAMGLSNVRLEPVPVDVFEFEEASLTVAGRRMTASTIAGVPPAPPDGVSAPIVYVKGGTAADFDAAGDVSGRLVLIDMKMSSWWFCLPAFEAAYRKAAGVVCTYTPDDPKYYSVDDKALGSFDGQYDLGAPPWIYVSRRDGDWLKSQLGSGPVTATMVLKEKVTLARDGGVAYNVVGELPGSRGDGQMMLMAAHQDAHFRAGADDTAALVNMLTIAKSMQASGYRPKRTVVFLATAGEEFGYTDSYYEWIIGAWWAATRAHADWAGRVRALINLESMAVKEAPLALRSNPELKPWLERLASEYPRFLPNGCEFLTPVNSWNDQWTFTAAGIPSVKFDATTPEYEALYHSDYETSDVVDWPYLAKIAKFVFRAAGEMDDGLLPYSLKARADDLAAALKTDKLEDSRADPETISRLERALAAFGRAAAALDARTSSIPADRVEEVNGGLLAIEKTINSSFTALSPADDDITVYPHQAVLRDARGIDAALAALTAIKPAPAAALKALGGTYLTRLGLAFSYPVYQKHISRLDPGFDRIHWGAQGHLPKPLDVMPQYRKIQSEDYTGVVAELEAKQRMLLGELNERLEEMAVVLEWATSRIEASPIFSASWR
ncbi:MAG: M28 family peptidase [Candidatus Aminicenantes bacterium]|nr:M28 family peptidase [Candidatus Aminicenantes bacterium]